jgi:hypothetical protein
LLPLQNHRLPIVYHDYVCLADNKSVLAIAAVGVVALVGVAAVSNGGGELAAAGGAPASAADNGAVPPNVKEAREWIGKWKAKHGKN